MTGMLIGYARVSTNDQDLTAQKNAFAALGDLLQKAFTDQGLTGTNRARSSLREASAACRAGRLTRSLRDVVRTHPPQLSSCLARPWAAVGLTSGRSSNHWGRERIDLHS